MQALRRELLLLESDGHFKISRSMKGAGYQHGLDNTLRREDRERARERERDTYIYIYIKTSKREIILNSGS